MSRLLSILEKIREECAIKDSSSGLILGEKWLENSKKKVQKCLISSHLTRKAVATAMKEKAEIIITIHPPYFTDFSNSKIPKTKLELLQKLIQNEIAIYSLGDNWLVSEQGGFDYFLNLLDFDYRKKLNFITIDKTKTEGGAVGRYGERKKKIKLNDLVQLLYQNIECPFDYSGYNQSSIQSVVIFNEILNEDTINRILENSKIDVVIFGDIAYEALKTLQLSKKPFIHLTRRVLENAILGKIRRRIMEEITLDLPDIVVVKQEKFGTTYSG